VRKFWIVFVIIVLLIGGGLGLLWKAITSLEVPVAAEGSILHWHAAGGYPETPPDDLLQHLEAGDRPTFSQLLLGLRRAAGDPGVETLLIDLRGLSVNWAQLEELHAAVADLRAAGKTTWAYIESGGNADFAVACAADRIAMAPEGNLMVLGVAAELAFFRETLAKVGLEAEFLHVGEYKSAPEQLTRTGPSEANRRMTTDLVEGRYELLVELIASGRGRSVAEVQAWIDRGLYDGPTALAAGLVDTLLVAEDLLPELGPEDDVAALEDYVRGAGRDGGAGEIALVLAEGTIFPGRSRRDELQGRIMGAETVIDHLARAREDADVDAVVLRIDSPGGSALASDLIWREVARVRDAKPIVVSMGGYAASGGYYIACGADSIFAGAGTLTGSIGVFAGKIDWSGLYDKLGVHREFIQRGENALFWRDAGGFSPAQREMFQDQLESFYERFLAKVAAGRGLDRDEVHAVAQGRVWTGEQGVAAGLVDAVGGLERALRSARVLAGVAPDARVRIRTYAEPLTWFERALLDALRTGGDDAVVGRALAGLAGGSRAAAAAGSSLGGSAGTLTGLPSPLGDIARGLARAGLADVAPLLDGRPVALMPWREVARPGL